jgi:hypothetical protein
MGLNLIDLIGGIEWISAVANGTSPLLFVGCVEEYFETVQKEDF